MFDLLVNADVVAQRLAIQDRRQVELLQLPVIQRMAHAKDVGASDHFINLAESKFGHDLPQVFGEEPEEVYHVIGITCEKPAQRLVLRGDAYRTSIQASLAHHNAPYHDDSRGGNAPFFGSQSRRNGDVATRADLSVRLKHHPAPEIVLHQRLVRFGETEFPGQPGMTN